jgi:hypothetical protein
MSDHRERMPNRRRNSNFYVWHEGHRYRVTAGHFADGRLGEIFLDTGKPQTALQSNADTAAILTSLLLQHGVSPGAIRHSAGGPISVALSKLAEGE